MIQLIKKLRTYRIIDQFSRFFLVGIVAFSADALILQGLVSLFSWDPYMARIPSATTAIFISWVLNRSFTFQIPKHHARLRTILAHISATGIALCANLAIYWGLIGWYPLLNSYPIIALAAASAFGLFVNFLLAKYWVFG